MKSKSWHFKNRQVI